MYGSLPLAIFGFFEEALPGTDFIPTATLGLFSLHSNLTYITLIIYKQSTAWIYYYFIYNEEKKKKKQ